MRKFLHIIVVCTIGAASANGFWGSFGPKTSTDAAAVQREARSLGEKWDRQSLDSAIGRYDDAADLWRKAGDRGNESTCLREAGSISILLNDQDRAYKYFNRSLSALGGAGHPLERSRAHSALALFELLQGRNKESQEHSALALALAKEAADSEALANAKISIGEWHYWMGEAGPSIGEYQEAVDLFRSTGNAAAEADGLIRLGYAYLRQNDHTKALEAFNAASARSAGINDIRDRAMALKALGKLYTATNKRQDAIRAYREAEKLFPDGVDNSEKASLFGGLAFVYENFGEYELARDYCARGYELFKLDGHKVGQAALLPDVARISILLGDFETARGSIRDELELAKGLQNELYAALAYEQLGNWYFLQQMYPEASANFKRALDWFKPRGQLNQVSRIDRRLGQIHLALNEPAEAERYFKEALSLNERVRDDFLEAEVLYNLSRLSLSAGRADDALGYIGRSVDLSEDLSNRVASSNLSTSYFSTIFERYEFYIRLLMDRHAREPDSGFDLLALQVAERSRARAMLEKLQLTEANFTRDADPAVVERERDIDARLRRAADKLTDLLGSNGPRGEIEKLENERRDLANELEEVRANLKENSPIYSAIKEPPPLNIPEFQQRVLDDSTVLIEFAVGEESSYLWVVGRGGASSFKIPGRAVIDARTAELRALIDDRQLAQAETLDDYNARIAAADRTYWEKARAFSTELLGPAAGLLRGKRLVIVPDGPLRRFPIAALPMPGSDEPRPMLAENEVVYEPSASLLSLLRRNEDKPKTDSKDLLIYSDPIFSADDPRSAGKPDDAPSGAADRGSYRFVDSLENLPRLKGSKLEAESVVEIINSSSVDAFAGASARRDNLLSSRLSDYKIIHFATHGLVDESHPELSGIVLSRFDEGRNQIDEMVRLQDIYSMDLNADLVVLSACGTGIGKDVKGEGLMSLNNAFLQVGAETVVSSMWKVEDTATLELMKEFYSGISDGQLSTSEALRRAQLKLLDSNRYRSPFYWAAFTMNGDFGSKPQLRHGRVYWPLLLLAVPAVIFAAMRLRKRRLVNKKTVVDG